MCPGVNNFWGNDLSPYSKRKLLSLLIERNMSSGFLYCYHLSFLTLMQAPATSLQLVEFPLISSVWTALALTVHTKILSFVVLVCLYSCASICPIVLTPSIVCFLLWAPGGEEWSLFNLVCTMLHGHRWTPCDCAWQWWFLAWLDAPKNNDKM